MTHALTLLGRARLDGRLLPRDRRGCLLLMLAIADGWVERPQVLDLLWPDFDEPRARHALRQLLVRLRRAALGPPVETLGDALRWSVASDLRAFRAALAAAEPAVAIAAYGGPLADGFIVHGAAFESWLNFERRGFHEAVLRAASDALQAGDAARSAALLRRLVEADPLDEDALQAYARALLAAGRGDAARRAIERFALGVRAETGLEVRPETATLAAQAAHATAARGSAAPAASSGSGTAAEDRGDPNETASANLDRLDPTVRRVLEPLALAQGTVASTVLARATGLEAHAVADALDGAERAGVLRDGRFVDPTRRDVIAADVPRARRQLLHRELADACAADGDHAGAADHHLAAGDPGAARRAWLRAASRLVDRGRPAEAAALLTRAQQRVPEGVDRAWLLVALADAERSAGRYAEAAASLAGADDAWARDAVADGAADPALALRTALARAALALAEGRMADAARALEGRDELAALVGDDGLKLELAMLRARQAHLSGRPAEALALLDPQAARLRREQSGVPLAQVLASIGVLHGDLGDPEAARALLVEALEVCRALRARYLQVDVALSLVFFLAELRRYDEVDALAAETLALGDLDNLTVFRSNVAALCFEADRPAEALAHDRALLAAAAPPHVHAIATARSAEALARLGERSAVAAQLDAALAALATTDLPVARGWVALAVLRHGDEARLRRLHELVPHLGEDAVAPHQRAAFRAAWAARFVDAPPTVPTPAGDARA